MPVREIATLPPCLFGVRLHRTLLDALDHAGVFIHLGVRDLRAEIAGGRCREIRDGDGRRYQADGYIAGTGGVLMGGLEVGSDGIVADPVFGLPVRQTHPLDQSTPSAAVDALHRAGIATDSDFRPRTADGRSVENLRIVGAALADWNPCEEGSLEGVAIGTGWAAAEAAA
jgi:glycerol-3-phosphate dehydrogenase subunit B